MERCGRRGANGRRPARKNGFTLIELLVVVSIIALLISILLPSLGKAKELANKVYCGANLHGISETMIEYAQENNDFFPTTAGPAGGTTYNSLNQTLNSTTTVDLAIASIANNHPANAVSPFWILALQKVPPKIFLCKSDPYIVAPAPTAAPTGGYYDNFQVNTQLSYSIAYPWLGTTVSSAWRNKMESQTPTLSDMAPLSGDSTKNTAAARGTTSKDFNSWNHNSLGQNVAFADGHAEFDNNPYVGNNADNIFTVRPASGLTSAGGMPITSMYNLPASVQAVDTPFDTVMVPCRKSDGSF